MKANLAVFERLVEALGHHRCIINDIIETDSSKTLINEFFLNGRK